MTEDTIDGGRIEAKAWAARADDLATWVGKHLLNRRDIWGGYVNTDERDKVLPSGAKLGATLTRPPKKHRGKINLERTHLIRHFRCRVASHIVGLHTTSPANASRWGAVEVDWHGPDSTGPALNLAAAISWFNKLRGYGIRPLLTDSNGVGGFHLLTVFAEPLPTPDVYRFCSWLVSDHEYYGLPAPPEKFPKQAKIKPGGSGPGSCGNWLRVFGKHHTRDHWSKVWNGENWLQGTDAIAYILAMQGNEPALLPWDEMTNMAIENRIRGYMRKLPNLAEGQGRDDIAYKFAAWLVRDMHLDDAEALVWLAEWDGANSPPKGLDRLGEIIQSAHTYGQRAYGAGLNRDRPGSNGHSASNGTTAGPATSGNDAASPGKPNSGKHPEILVTTDERRVNDEAVAALAAEPDLYQRGNYLVHVLRENPKKRRNLFRPPGSPRIVPLPRAKLREMMAACANWTQEKKDRRGDIQLVAVHPPDWAVAGVDARGSWDEAIRHLEAVVEAPTLRHNGDILDRPGWDEETGLLYEPRIEFPVIASSPTLAQARTAAKELLCLVADFPFTKDHSAAWLAALLTPFARFAFAGPSPLFLFTANAPGSGKTLLAWTISEIFEGRELSRTPYPFKDEEMAKTITSVAIAGDRIVLFDNIDSSVPFGCASLDAALTGTSWKQRILGVSEMTPDLPLFTTWMASGNNTTFRGDVHRRVLPCRLETQEEHPESRSGFQIPNLIEHVRAYRAILVAKVLTILRGYFVAGRPSLGLTPFGSYEGWSATVRGAVAWATDVDPLVTRAGVTESDEALATMARVIDGWCHLPGGSNNGLTIAEAIRFVRGDSQEQFQVLRDALMSWSKDDRLPGALQIGYRFRAMKGRVIRGRSLLGEPDLHDGITRWKVKEGENR